MRALRVKVIWRLCSGLNPSLQPMLHFVLIPVLALVAFRHARLQTRARRRYKQDRAAEAAAEQKARDERRETDRARMLMRLGAAAVLAIEQGSESQLAQRSKLAQNDMDRTHAPLPSPREPRQAEGVVRSPQAVAWSALSRDETLAFPSHSPLRLLPKCPSHELPSVSQGARFEYELNGAADSTGDDGGGSCYGGGSYYGGDSYYGGGSYCGGSDHCGSSDGSGCSWYARASYDSSAASSWGSEQMWTSRSTPSRAGQRRCGWACAGNHGGFGNGQNHYAGENGGSEYGGGHSSERDDGASSVSASSLRSLVSDLSQHSTSSAKGGLHPYLAAAPSFSLPHSDASMRSPISSHSLSSLGAPRRMPTLSPDCTPSTSPVQSPKSSSRLAAKCTSPYASPYTSPNTTSKSRGSTSTSRRSNHPVPSTRTARPPRHC